MFELSYNLNGVCGDEYAPRRIKEHFYAGVAQLAECNLAKVEVAGSNPVTRFHLQSEVK